MALLMKPMLRSSSATLLLDRANFAAWVTANKGVPYKQETGTDGSRKTISHVQFASLCQTRSVKAFKNVSIEWNYPLDRIITYGHIKKFLMET